MENNEPTPQEIADFEKANPGIVAEEKETRPLSQWPIRVGLMLLPLLCFWEWAWFKKAMKKLPIVLLFIAAFAFAQPFAGPIPKTVGGGTSNSGFTPITAGLLAWYKFNENTGTIANDSSGNGYTGTLSGSTLPSWVSGVPGSPVSPYALSFNGSTAYVLTTLNQTTISSDYSVSLWVYVTASGDALGWAGLVLVYTYPPSPGVSFTVDSSFFDGAFVSPGITSSAWHSVIGTFSFSSGLQTLYIDGTSVATATKTTTYSSHALWIGASEGNAFFSGSISDVRVYNRVLNSTEASQIALFKG